MLTGVFRHLALLTTLIASLTIGGLAADAQAKVVARVDLSSQTMHVIVDGRSYAHWKVSTGRKGYRTPTGVWRPKVLRRMHYSRKYDNAPMPYSIFFYHGYAIHGTDAIRRLGRPASHGCVRLHPKHARALYNLVRQYGRSNTRIQIAY